MMTDPIADLLTRIRNGCHARRDNVLVPWSRMKESIAGVLKDEGYLRDFQVAGEGASKALTIYLRYSDSGQPAITGVRRVSRPGLRRYTSADKAPRVRSGLGVSVLSTPLGLMPDREARRRKVGGEVLCEVW